MAGAAVRLVDWALAGLVRGAFAALRALGPVRASNWGGAVARTVGPRLPVSRIGRVNLAACLPGCDAGQREVILRAVWDNLGRTVAEMPHVHALRATASGPGWEFVAHPDALSGSQDPRGGIYVGAHTANWEVVPALARAMGAPLGIFYRAAGNRAVDGVIRGLRAGAGGPELRQFAKGAAGAREAMVHVRRGGRLGILADQKTNEGSALPFLGHLAMTSTAAATLARKFDLPVIPARVERLGPARLRLTLEAPLPRVATGDRTADIAVLTGAINACFERWIRERPGEWLWLHRRWPQAFYARHPTGASAVEAP